jgi:hypothetical protein
MPCAVDNLLCAECLLLAMIRADRQGNVTDDLLAAAQRGFLQYHDQEIREEQVDDGACLQPASTR